MDQLTALLVNTNGNAGLSSLHLMQALNVDDEVILKSVESMQELVLQLIFTNFSQSELGTSYTVRIPESEKWRATDILRNGGWGKIFNEHFAKLNSEKKRIEKRNALEEESWIATKAQAEHAKKISKRANIIAILSALIALLSLILQFFQWG